MVYRIVVAVLAVLLVSDGQRIRPRFVVQRPVAGSSSNPIAAARLPGGDATVPNPSWALAGVEGGIPAGSICDLSGLLGYSDDTLGTDGQLRTYDQTANGDTITATDINNALAACDNGGSQSVVVLETGTYNLSSGITFPGDRVTLRGEGPDSTLLVFTNDVSCGGQFAPICMGGNFSGSYPGGTNDPANVADWTGTGGVNGTYTQGATTITLSTTANLSVGEHFVLDQLPETSDPGSSLWIWNCAQQYTGSAGCTEQGGAGSVLARNCGGDGGGDPGEDYSTCRVQHQIVQVVSCSPSCPNAGSTEVTIDRPIYAPNWRTGQDPEAWWGSDNWESYQGIEDLSIDNLNGATSVHAIVVMMYTTNTWMKHVRALFGPSSSKAWVLLYGGSRATIRDSYFYGTTDDSGSSTHYGIETYGSCDNLVENNIFEHRTSALVRDGDCGSVYAYNFSRDTYYDNANVGCCNDSWMQADHYSHAAGNLYVLDEGNIGVSAKQDSVHGTSHLFTFLRNRWDGRDQSYKDTETNPVMLHPFQRGMNYVCNVLGTSGYHTNYETNNSVTTIWRFRTWFNGNGTYSDSVQASTLMRWGNWDVVSSTGDTSDNNTDGIKWDAAEVPDGLSYLPNADPSSQTCPTSLYLSAKPSFMGGGDPWPGIGPDVTGSQTGTNGITGVGGHAYENPAKQCYDTLSDDTAYSAAGDGSRPKRFSCSYPL